MRRCTAVAFSSWCGRLEWSKNLTEAAYSRAVRHCKDLIRCLASDLAVNRENDNVLWIASGTAVLPRVLTHEMLSIILKMGHPGENS